MHLSSGIETFVVALFSGSFASVLSFLRTRRTEAGRRRLQAGRDELDGRRLSMEEFQAIVDNLRRDVDDLRRQRTDDQREIAQLRRDVVKEQRRSNLLHERLERLLQWLNEQGVEVPSALAGWEE